MIEVKNIVKQYGDNRVVNDVSFKLEKKKITSFIGPNGAGKSTLLSIIARIMDKNDGEVFIEGMEIGSWDSRELAKKVSILRQSNHVNIRLTIRELVSFGRFPYSNGRLTSDDWVYVDKAIQYMQLEDIQDRYLDQLSGGQRQRAYIAMVIAQDTEYILLDEPLNNLDMRHSVEIMKTLRNLVDELGKTIAIVIHDINFASCYSDSLVILDEGKVAKKGSVDQIITKEILEDVYNIEFSIENIKDNRICIYY